MDKHIQMGIDMGGVEEEERKEAKQKRMIKLKLGFGKRDL
jgi:hypothetical protein